MREGLVGPRTLPDELDPASLFSTLRMDDSLGTDISFPAERSQIKKGIYLRIARLPCRAFVTRDLFRLFAFESCRHVSKSVRDLTIIMPAAPPYALGSARRLSRGRPLTAIRQGKILKIPGPYQDSSRDQPRLCAPSQTGPVYYSSHPPSSAGRSSPSATPCR